jgi:hypothetical protein
MATHTHSDLSGDEIPDYSTPVEFDWNDSHYAIDLTTAETDRFNAAKADLVKALELLVKADAAFDPFLTAARFVPTSVPAEPIKSPRKPRKAAAKKTTALKPTRTRRPAKSSAKAFSPPAEDLVLPDEPASNGNGKTTTRPADVRAWANENGYSLPTRGRIPAATTAAYEAAMTG